MLDSVSPEVRQLCGCDAALPARAGPTVSIVAAACNRTGSLLRVLPSWLAVKGVDEVVLLDWSSEPPLSSLPLPVDRRLRVVRVAGEREWTLARAYNLAVQLARADIILKVDADTWLDPEVLAAQPLAPSAVGGGGSGVAGGGGVTAASDFLRGCRDDAPDENARHLNGVLLARRSDVLRVRGYDERMRKYGFDDTDLYARLGSAHLNRSGGCLSFGLNKFV